MAELAEEDGVTSVMWDEGIVAALDGVASPMVSPPMESASCWS